MVGVVPVHEIVVDGSEVGDDDEIEVPLVDPGVDPEPVVRDLGDQTRQRGAARPLMAATCASSTVSSQRNITTCRNPLTTLPYLTAYLSRRAP